MISTDYNSKFEQIYLKNLRNVEFLANSYLKDMEMARSVAHDSFLALWEKRQEIDFDGEVLPYLFIVAKNKCFNILKKEKSRDKFSTYSAYREHLLNQESIHHHSSSLYEQDVIRLTENALNSMPAKVKETFLLCKNEGLKNREIALKQNISISTVEYRISSAYRILRKCLKDYLPFFLWFLIPMCLLYIQRIIIDE